MIIYGLRYQRAYFEEVAVSANKTQKEYQELKQYEDKFSQTNATTILIQQSLKLQQRWTNIFKTLDTITPQDITLDSIFLDSTGSVIHGVAKDRDTLLEFEQRMRDHSCFQSVEVPLSSLVQKENVNFEMDFSVQAECLLLSDK